MIVEMGQFINAPPRLGDIYIDLPKTFDRFIL